MGTLLSFVGRSQEDGVFNASLRSKKYMGIFTHISKNKWNHPIGVYRSVAVYEAVSSCLLVFTVFPLNCGKQKSNWSTPILQIQPVIIPISLTSQFDPVWSLVLNSKANPPLLLFFSVNQQPVVLEPCLHGLHGLHCLGGLHCLHCLEQGIEPWPDTRWRPSYVYHRDP